MTQAEYAALREGLRIDCARCCGLCCVALYCMKTDGFPADKAAGVPCQNLLPDFRCQIHKSLAAQGMRGCLSYDCFGAGQRATEKYPTGINWQSEPARREELFAVFERLFQLHQMEWYLLSALPLAEDCGSREALEALIVENETRAAAPPEELLRADAEELRRRVNHRLKALTDALAARSAYRGSKDCFGKSLRGATLDYADLSMALLIGADLEGCSLQGTNLLGADLRGANLKNTDLSTCLFLTQMQLNSAVGNARTAIPPFLCRPGTWV